jgi:hypothetical protein
VSPIIDDLRNGETQKTIFRLTDEKTADIIKKIKINIKELFYGS